MNDTNPSDERSVRRRPPLAVEGDRGAVGFRVRFADQDWKRLLNRLIAENQPAINKVLLGFGVPLLDDSDHPIGEDAVGK